MVVTHFNRPMDKKLAHAEFAQGYFARPGCHTDCPKLCSSKKVFLLKRSDMRSTRSVSTLLLSVLSGTQRSMSGTEGKEVMESASIPNWGSSKKVFELNRSDKRSTR